jgi:hypothetical protein
MSAPAIAPAYLRRQHAASYLGVSLRYFRRHVHVRPKEFPGRGKRPLLMWAVVDLDRWVESVSNPKSRANLQKAS